MTLRILCRFSQRAGLLGLAVASFTLQAQTLTQAPNQTPAPLFIDASQPTPSPAPAAFQPGSNLSPAHHVLRLNDRYLTYDGKPWLPVMGEFHFSRTPEADWEPELLKMKAAGVQVVATYIFWIHHEEVEGEWDWSGQRDLHHFVELCRKHGFYVYIRLGPWAHGEARNGGFPDWLLAKASVRRSNPVYLGYVEQFWSQIAGQLRGELWKEGGPVIGVQLENEYASRGPGAGEEHILALKRLALAQGFDVPFYSVTGWDRAVVPHGAVLPVYGGYPDAPWDTSLQPLPPNEVYLFRFTSRVAGNMGMIGAPTGQPTPTPAPIAGNTPFLTAEMGGGIQDTYHRRPWLTPDDVAAMVPVMLGSGVNLYGTYMFHGGQNPEGKRTTLQESQATHYPSDLPVRSYDFQAPISPFGEERPLLRKLKVANYFLNDFGPQLAPMVPHAPALLPTGPADLSVPRVAVRSAGDNGFVFVNNHLRGATMPARPGFQLQIKLPEGTLTLPEHPLTLPPDAYFIWPFHLDLAGVPLRYSTAQLFTRLNVHGTPTFVFFCLPAIRCEFNFDSTPQPLSIDAPGVTPQRTSTGATLITELHGGLEQLYTLRLRGKVKARLLVVTAQQAENAWKVSMEGEDHLLFTSADVYTEPGRAVLESNGDPRFNLQIFPVLRHTPHASAALKRPSGPSQATSLQADFPVATAAVHLTLQQPAAFVPVAELGPASPRHPGNALSPEETGMAAAARWRLDLTSPSNTRNLSDILLRMRYTGDLAQLEQDGHLLADNFFNGAPWTVGLRDFGTLSAPGPFTLSIRPLNPQSAIFLEPEIRRTLPAAGQVLTLDAVEAVPRYRLILDTGTHPQKAAKHRRQAPSFGTSTLEQAP